MNDELTKIDIKKMREEIEYRTLELSPKLREELRRTREFGDLSENFEYRTAKREVNKNYSRIRYLQRMIDTAIIIEPKTDAGIVGLFDKVELYMEDEDETMNIVIVTTLRQDALSGYISKESPLGKAIMGHKVGDRVLIKVSDTYSYYAVVRSIVKGEDDDSLQINRY